MNYSKSESSASSSHFSGNAAIENRKKALARKFTSNYESSTFSRPAVDQLNGILPDFNRRLSSERDLGLTPAGSPRLSSENLPRLFSDSCIGISSSASQEKLSGKCEVPAVKGLEIKPDLAGRTLTGASVCFTSIQPDLPITPLKSRFVNLRQAEDELKEENKN
jgi:hypothetical protein